MSRSGAQRSTVANEKLRIIKQLQLPDTERLLHKLNTRDFSNIYTKNEKSAREWRRLARVSYTDENIVYHDDTLHRKIWYYLCRALANSPINSIEYVMSLDARSKLLFHMKMYRECEKDVDRALAELEMRKEVPKFKADLMLRKIKCWTSSVNYIPRPLYEQLIKYIFEIPATLSEDKARIFTKLSCLNSQYLSYLTDGLGDQDFALPELETQRVRNLTKSEVTMKYKGDRGFHMTALRNFETGELICVEDIYTSFPSRRDPMICWHCLATSWTPIPCYACTALFCSEKCRDEATTNYHYFECVLYRNELGNDYCIKSMDVTVLLGLRLFLKHHVSYESSEGVEKCALKPNMHEWYELTSIRNPKPVMPTKTNFQTFFSRGSRTETKKNALRSCVIALITAAKNCNLFMQSYFEFNGIRDLIESEEAVLVGALILRYSEIARLYSQNFVDPNVTMWVDSAQRLHFQAASDFTRGIVISPVGCFINHSCFPNVVRVFNDAGQIVYYVTRPIAKDQELLICYNVPYHSTLTKKERQKILHERYGFVCKCEPCKEDYLSSEPKSDGSIEHIIVEPEIYNRVFIEEVREQFVKFLIYKEHIDKPNNVRLQRMIRDNLSDAMNKIAKKKDFAKYHETIALYYMLRIVFEKLLGVRVKKVPDTCAKSWLSSQLRQIRQDHPDSDSRAPPRPVACSSPTVMDNSLENQ